MPVGEVLPVRDGIVADDADVEGATGRIAFLIVGPSGGEVLNLTET